VLTRLIPIAFVCFAARGQATDPAFEVASIKPAVPLGPLGRRFIVSGGPGTRNPGLYRCQNCSLYQAVMQAYDINLPAKFSGPDWLEGVRFDFSAKLPEGTTSEKFHLMLQNLLAERFRLKVHGEKKEMALYELVVARNGPKFKESTPKDPPKDDAPPEKMETDREGYPILAPGTTMAVIPGHARIQSENQTMEWLADMLSGPMGGLVVDATGLQGKYDFVLSWAIEEKGASAAEPVGPSLLIGPEDV